MLAIIRIALFNAQLTNYSSQVVISATIGASKVELGVSPLEETHSNLSALKSKPTNVLTIELFPLSLSLHFPNLSPQSSKFGGKKGTH